MIKKSKERDEKIMHKKHLKGIVTMLAGITLGSSVVGSGISVVNASEKEPMIQMSQKEDMSKYYTKVVHDDGTFEVNVDSTQVTQYLLDHGVKPNELPSELKQRRTYRYFHIQKLKGHGNYNIYLTKEFLKLSRVAGPASHLMVMLFDVFRENVVGASIQVWKTVRSIIEEAKKHYHHGIEIYIRHYRYKGHKAW